eukprot:6174436-Pleurochrysis_carterae.AAC.1
MHTRVLWKFRSLSWKLMGHRKVETGMCDGGTLGLHGGHDCEANIEICGSLSTEFRGLNRSKVKYRIAASYSMHCVRVLRYDLLRMCVCVCERARACVCVCARVRVRTRANGGRGSREVCAGARLGVSRACVSARP